MIRTLIVDDEKYVRMGLISVMPWELYGFSVVGEAANGEKALEFVKKNEVDLIFVDLTMPVLSGLELMCCLRTDFPHIFMVVLTCHQSFEHVQEALRLGAIDYILKTHLEKETMEGVLERIAGRIHQERAGTEAPADTKNTEASAVISISTDVRLRFSDEIIKSILDAAQYVYENLNSEISQDAVASKVNMSRGYFSKCFKDITGKFFGEFVRETKINKAKDLLLQTNKPVYWIAEQLGFHDEKYFSRFFKEYMAVLPSEYRTSNRF